MHTAIKIIFASILFFSQTSFAKELDKINLQLLWLHQFQFAGYYMAKEKGFYKERGLEVNFKEFGHGIIPVDEVLNNDNTYGIGRSSLIIDKSHNKNIQLIAAMFQTSPLVLMASPNANIKTLKDLKNKRIMLSPDESTSVSINAMLHSQRISLDEMIQLPHSFDVSDFLNDKVDVTSAYISAQPYTLQKMGMKPIIFDPKDYGFDFYNDILFTSQKEATKNPSRVQDFKEASLKGWDYVFNHIDEAVDLVYKYYNLQNKSKEELLYEANSLKELAYFQKASLGQIDPIKLEKIYNIFNVMGYIKNHFNVRDLIFTYDKESLHLSKEEQEFIRTSPAIKYSEVNWKPLSIIENNKMSGIMGDYLDLVAFKTGLTFELIEAQTWSEALELFEQKAIDLIPGVGSSEKERALGLISNKYASYPMVIITDQKYRYIDKLSELDNKILAIPKNYTSYNFIIKNYPHFKIIETKDIQEALLLVSNGKADAFIGHIATSLYYISDLHLRNLKISGTTEFKFDHHYLVQNDNAILLSIINKAFNNISQKEKDAITSKWVITSVEESVNREIILIITLFFLLILMVLLYRQHILKKFNKQLKNSHFELENILDSALEGVIISQNGICLDVNNAALALFEFTHKKEMIGKSIDLFLPFNQEQIELENFEKPYEIKANKSNNESFIGLVKNNSIYVQEKKVFISSIVDLTLLKEKETLLIEQSKMAALGEMLGNIAHQWRQPLSIISTLSSSYKLKDELNLPIDMSELANDMDQINQNAQYLSQTIDDFRNFIKGEASHSKVNLTEVIDLSLKIQSSLIKTHRIEVIKEYSQSVELICFKNGLLQVLINIINNAKDSVLNNEEKNRFIYIKTTLDEKYFNIEIIDNGQGIKEEILDNIFEPYFTTKHQAKGTGLGLYMSYNIILKMNGSLKADNAFFMHNNHSYEGARFTISLPLIQKETP